MDKRFYRYMIFGRRIKWDGEEYVLLNSMSPENEEVNAVKASDHERYSQLVKWSFNGVGLTDEQQIEMESFVHQIPCGQCEPADKVRFIDSHYNTKLTVTSGDQVEVGGERVRVFALDDFHIVLVNEDGKDSFRGKSGYFHVGHFAGMCEIYNFDVCPVA